MHGVAQFKPLANNMTPVDRGYILLCTALGVCFVPVLFFFGLTAAWLPLSAVAFDFLAKFMGWMPPSPIQPLVLLYCLGYTLVFLCIALAVAFLTARLNCLTKWRLRWLYCVMLFLISFLPVITYTSIRGNGGDYSFWTAIPRFVDKYMHYK